MNSESIFNQPWQISEQIARDRAEVSVPDLIRYATYSESEIPIPT